MGYLAQRISCLGFQKQPTDDLEFRRAVRYALNYELLATTIGGEDGQVPGEAATARTAICD